MRRTTSFCLILLCVAMALGALINVAGAQERTTLSSWLGRLLKIKKSQPVEDEVAPPTVQAIAQQPKQLEPAHTDGPMTRLPEAKSSSLPYPPFPPGIQQAWIHPPVRQQHPRVYHSTDEIVALTRNAGSRLSSRRGLRTPTSDDSVLEASNFDPAGSPAITTVSFSVPDVRQVNHVAELAAPPIESLPVGNMPAEVGEPVMDEPATVEPATVEPPTVAPRTVEPRTVTPATVEPGEIESALPKRTEIAVLPKDPLPARPLASVAPVFQKVRGRIVAIDATTGIIRVDLSEEESLPTGTKIRVYHETETGETVTVHMRVLDSVAGVAAARLTDEAPLDSVAPGDKTIAWKTDAGQTDAGQ